MSNQPNCCQNCDYDYQDHAYTYCPNCGQKRLSRLTIGSLFESLMSSFFSLDSRLYHSIVPFLFQPGKIAKDFIDGKRKTYMSPSRMYFFFSFLLLLVVTSLFVNNWDKQISQVTHSMINSKEFTIKKSENLKFKRSDPGEKKGLFTKTEVDSLTKADLEEADISMEDVEKIQNLIDQGKSNKEIYEATTEVSRRNGSHKMITYFGYNILRNQGKNLLITIFSQLAVGFAVALALFTLLLQLFYIRRPFTIAEHFVHAVYFFSFFFFLLTFCTIGMYGAPGLFWPLLFFGALLLYLYKSMRKVYEQKRGKTLLKFTLFSVSSSLLIIFAVTTVIFLLSLIQYK